MAVYDRWHKSFPREGDKPCECSTKSRTLYPTKDHKKGMQWQVRWRDAAGEPQKLNRPRKGGKRDESDPEIYAEALDAKIKHELNQGKYRDPNAGKATMGAHTRQWRDNLTGDLKTLEQVDSRLANWVYGLSIEFQELRVLEQKPSLVQAWVKSLERRLRPSTIRVVAGTVSTIFEAAVLDGVIDRNPMKTRAVTLPKVPDKEVQPWTLEQMDAAAAALPGRFAAIPDVGAGTGLRQGEIFGLARQDVELMLHVRRQIRIVGGQLVFSPPKGGRPRNVPLDPYVRQRLRDHMAAFPPVRVRLPWAVPDGELVAVELVFTEEGGLPIRSQQFNRRHWAGARRAAGPETRENAMHVLRHTAASAWLAGGVDINTVAEWLGHRDVAFTLKTYIHLMPDAADRGRAAMTRFFERKIDRRSALEVPSEAHTGS